MRSKILLCLFIVFWAIIPIVQSSAQQDSPYDEGTVWTMTFIRTAANHGDDYMKDLAKTWVATMDEAVSEGLIVSYKILQGTAANEDDFNLVLMIENKSMADFDPNKDRDAKFDAINKKITDKMGKDEFDKVVANYDEIRDLQGSKLMRELHLKK
jgi:hypothetical protein